MHLRFLFFVLVGFLLLFFPKIKNFHWNAQEMELLRPCGLVMTFDLLIQIFQPSKKKQMDDLNYCVL